MKREGWIERQKGLGLLEFDKKVFSLRRYCLCCVYLFGRRDMFVVLSSGSSS